MKRTGPRALCEEILRSRQKYNIDNNILPSENAVIERLLARHVELNSAYSELERKLHSIPGALEAFFDTLLGATAFWNPYELTKARDEKERLLAINAKIATAAAELASLLQERSKLNGQSGFNTDTHYDVCEFIISAAAHNHLFNSYFRDSVSALSAQFDMKYWPSLSEFVHALSIDAEHSVVKPCDPITAAGTASSRPSLADFVRAWFVAMEKNRVSDHGFLPDGVDFTDETIASFTNCALGLGPDDIKDGAYVKNLRQRQRRMPLSGRIRGA